MKKTLTVNISGVVFHIDEDAYNVLHDYLQSIKKHFAREEGGDEIVSDIEARIAEMLRERIGDERQVITIDDIEEVIRVIGMPEEFGEEFSSETGSQEGTFKGKAPKRLYRDPENSILGGVCGGLGAYFHTDPVWFRLAFVVLSIPGIGSPLLVYVVLWIVIPEARTAAERLEMRGERVNISNIEKSIKEEISNLKDKFNEFTKEAKRTYKKKSAAHRPDIQQVESAVQQMIHVFVRVVLIFIGFIFSIIGLALILSFLVLFFGLGYDFFVIDSDVAYVSINRLIDLFVGSVGSSLLFRASFLLMIGIPIAMLLYAGIKLIFRFERTRYVGLAALNIWIISILVSSFYGFRIFRDFSHKGFIEEKTKIEIPAGRILNISSRSDDTFDRIVRFGDYIEIDETNVMLTSDERHLFYGIPRVEFVCSSDNTSEFRLYSYARGKSTLLAEERAGRTLYEYEVTKGKISMDPYFKLPYHEVWREQELNIMIVVPEGTILQIGENMRPIINDHRHSPYRLAGGTWIMTKNGLEETEFQPQDEPPMKEEIHEIDPVRDLQPIQHDSSKSITVVDFVYENFRQIFQYVVGA
ncbi:MAG: PspC domain-containing protein [Bacteroidetes bacterium]|nr:PspC domain-containing protein [Bacteroidota bacterium]